MGRDSAPAECARVLAGGGGGGGDGGGGGGGAGGPFADWAGPPSAGFPPWGDCMTGGGEGAFPLGWMGGGGISGMDTAGKEGTG